MKKVSVKPFVKVKVIVNTMRKDKAQHGRIVADVPDGRILHTGQLSYIRKVAREKYNLHVSF
jgi:hypothetical protein